MIDVGVKIKTPVIKIDCPEKRFYQGVGVTEAREIHKRTLKGKDADESRFAAYSDAYKKLRATGKAQKSVGPRQVSTVNLSMSKRLLSSMARGIKATKRGVTLNLSGEDGFKAHSLENSKKRREFFSLSDKRVLAIRERVKRWMTKKNGLK